MCVCVCVCICTTSVQFHLQKQAEDRVLSLVKHLGVVLDILV